MSLFLVVVFYVSSGFVSLVCWLLCQSMFWCVDKCRNTLAEFGCARHHEVKVV